MTWLTPILIIRLAFAPTTQELSVTNGYRDWSVMPDHRVSMDVTAGVKLFGVLSVEGQINTECVPPWENGSIYFAPYQSDYYFRVYAEYKGLSVGLEHLCRHPTISGTHVTQWYGGHDEFWIQYELQLE